MLLGKRPRHQIKRTTSMTEFAFDPSHPAPVEFAVAPQPLDPSDAGAAEAEAFAASPLPAAMLDHRSTVAALVSPRVTQRRYSADYGALAGTSQFLKSCCLCKRRFIPGRDIYMYRGDSAFCSLECRQQQISQDDRKERSSSLAPVKKSPAVTGRPSKAAAEGETVVGTPV